MSNPPRTQDARRAATASQPAPVTTDRSVDTWTYTENALASMGRAHLLPDLEARLINSPYDRTLQTHNGRDMLTDLYQEALDGVNYSAGYFLEVQTDFARDMFLRWSSIAHELALEIDGTEIL